MHQGLPGLSTDAQPRGSDADLRAGCLEVARQYEIVSTSLGTGVFPISVELRGEDDEAEIPSSPLPGSDVQGSGPQEVTAAIEEVNPNQSLITSRWWRI